ncbi:MAG: thiamine-phosphate kinase [Elusimicrobiales bacterium]|nr:thiamine-phosphate kinase [Elusimicrobiales bacterium]MCK5358368.1 thiamine-phosphate kinase [Elusimicrobiales bacterium]
MKMNESRILDYIEDNFAVQKDKRLLIGPGDDAAVLKTKSGKVLVATTDEMVEGTHFLKGFDYPEKLAKKLLRINLSDLAAMGNVKPLSCLSGGGMPKNTPAPWIKKFIKTLNKEAEKFGLNLSGGNLARSKNLHMYLTVLGEADKSEIITRYGAKPGDELYSIGSLGESKAGLEIFLSGKKPKTLSEKKLIERFWEPKPMMEAGNILGRYKLANCMLDNSDGLLRSVKIIAGASKRQVVLSLKEKDISKELKEYALSKRKNCLDYAISGGEDYGLIFTASLKNKSRIKKLLPKARVIGRIEKGTGVKFENYEGKNKSFEHF